MASVTSVAHNDKIDQNLIAAARRELEENDPELLILQLLAVDQNGHVRGTYYPEYVERIEITDRLIEDFMHWCEQNGYLDKDTAVILMADHGTRKRHRRPRPPIRRRTPRTLRNVGKWHNKSTNYCANIFHSGCCPYHKLPARAGTSGRARRAVCSMPHWSVIDETHRGGGSGQR